MILTAFTVLLYHFCCVKFLLFLFSLCDFLPLLKYPNVAMIRLLYSCGHIVNVVVMVHCRNVNIHLPIILLSRHRNSSFL